MNPPNEPIVFAVSDATGETAEQACRAALAQFSPDDMSRVRVIAHVLDEKAVEAAVKTAKEQGALLAYTLVASDVRGHMKQIAAREGVPAVDLLSNLINAIARHVGRDPLAMPGLGHQLDAEYFRRVEAVEFAVNNDDGRLPQNLKNADIVVVGLSRTSKTPLASEIAKRGYRVSNVPIVIEAPMPKELDVLDPRRVFGLVIDPMVLSTIRRTRMETLKMAPESAYGDVEQIRKELSFARRLFAAHPGWTVIDTTQKAVEETASLILETYRERFPDGEGKQPAKVSVGAPHAGRGSSSRQGAVGAPHAAPSPKRRKTKTPKSGR